MDSNAKLLDAIARDATFAAHEALCEGASLDTRTYDGLSLLEAAQKAQATHVARLLLDRGSSPNVQTPNGETLLHQAARQGDYGFVSILLEYGAETEALDRKRRRPVDVARPKEGYLHDLLKSKSQVHQPTLF